MNINDASGRNRRKSQPRPTTNFTVAREFRAFLSTINQSFTIDIQVKLEEYEAGQKFRKDDAPPSCHLQFFISRHAQSDTDFAKPTERRKFSPGASLVCARECGLRRKEEKPAIHVTAHVTSVERRKPNTRDKTLVLCCDARTGKCRPVTEHRRRGMAAEKKGARKIRRLVVFRMRCYRRSGARPMPDCRRVSAFSQPVGANLKHYRLQSNDQ